MGVVSSMRLVVVADASKLFDCLVAGFAVLFQIIFREYLFLDFVLLERFLIMRVLQLLKFARCVQAVGNLLLVFVPEFERPDKLSDHSFERLHAVFLPFQFPSRRVLDLLLFQYDRHCASVDDADLIPLFDLTACETQHSIFCSEETSIQDDRVNTPAELSHDGIRSLLMSAAVSTLPLAMPPLSTDSVQALT